MLSANLHHHPEHGEEEQVPQSFLNPDPIRLDRHLHPCIPFLLNKQSEGGGGQASLAPHHQQFLTQLSESTGLDLLPSSSPSGPTATVWDPLASIQGWLLHVPSFDMQCAWLFLKGLEEKERFLASTAGLSSATPSTTNAAALLPAELSGGGGGIDEASIVSCHVVKQHLESLYDKFSTSQVDKWIHCNDNKLCCQKKRHSWRTARFAPNAIRVSLASSRQIVVETVMKILFPKSVSPETTVATDLNKQHHVNPTDPHSSSSAAPKLFPPPVDHQCPDRRGDEELSIESFDEDEEPLVDGDTGAVMAAREERKPRSPTSEEQKIREMLFSNVTYLCVLVDEYDFVFGYNFGDAIKTNWEIVDSPELRRKSVISMDVRNYTRDLDCFKTVPMQIDYKKKPAAGATSKGDNRKQRGGGDNSGGATTVVAADTSAATVQQRQQEDTNSSNSLRVLAIDHYQQQQGNMSSSSTSSVLVPPSMPTGAAGHFSSPRSSAASSSGTLAPSSTGERRLLSTGGSRSKSQHQQQQPPQFLPWKAPPELVLVYSPKSLAAQSTRIIAQELQVSFGSVEIPPVEQITMMMKDHHHHHHHHLLMARFPSKDPSPLATTGTTTTTSPSHEVKTAVDFIVGCVNYESPPMLQDAFSLAAFFSHGPSLHASTTATTSYPSTMGGGPSQSSSLPASFLNKSSNSSAGIASGGVAAEGDSFASSSSSSEWKKVSNTYAAWIVMASSPRHPSMTPLIPVDSVNKSKVLHFCAEAAEFLKHLELLLLLVAMTPHGDEVRRGDKELNKVMASMERLDSLVVQHHASHTSGAAAAEGRRGGGHFFLGHTFSLADISIVSGLHRIMTTTTSSSSSDEASHHYLVTLREGLLGSKKLLGLYEATIDRRPDHWNKILNPLSSPLSSHAAKEEVNDEEGADALYQPQEVTLYGTALCPFSLRVRLFLEVARIRYKYIELEIPKPDWYAKIHPGKVTPSLVVDMNPTQQAKSKEQGGVITATNVAAGDHKSIPSSAMSLHESSQILRFLAEMYQENYDASLTMNDEKCVSSRSRVPASCPHRVVSQIDDPLALMEVETLLEALDTLIAPYGTLRKLEDNLKKKNYHGTVRIVNGESTVDGKDGGSRPSRSETGVGQDLDVSHLYIQLQEAREKCEATLADIDAMYDQRHRNTTSDGPFFLGALPSIADFAALPLIVPVMEAVSSSSPPSGHFTETVESHIKLPKLDALRDAFASIDRVAEVYEATDRRAKKLLSEMAAKRTTTTSTAASSSEPLPIILTSSSVVPRGRHITSPLLPAVAGGGSDAGVLLDHPQGMMPTGSYDPTSSLIHGSIARTE